MNLRLTAAPGTDEGTVHLEMHGYLDYETSEDFLATATKHLADTPGLRALHLNCGGLEGIDSMGLAMLLMLHRRTTAARVTLHLDQRTQALDRMLTVTGTMEHLVPLHQAGSGGQTAPQQMGSRHTAEDSGLVDSPGQGFRPAGPDTGA
ncbi:STAS domain-containing protein [Streptomyces sp. NPDC005963]|uniref:STAS domain-containing protein n=1 Tax=Streptomyces sp. NPDC005963 TaxID=3156721 RepID=UPI0033C63FA1